MVLVVVKVDDVMVLKVEVIVMVVEKVVGGA